MMVKDYYEKVYSGWLGKVIGVRLGIPVEGWSYERIKNEIGEPEGYIENYKMFAADDDTNGPVAFIRALEDYSVNANHEEMGKTWLNYIGDNHGMLWWGGYGFSTEHTAYLNLQNGIKAPMSGSIALNGSTVAEQIGGQIFIDVWGLITPGNPQKAAEYAEKAASVSHDGNGKYGGMFIAACVAEAFTESNMQGIIHAGLSVIPKDCEYARVTRDIMNFYERHPENWREAFQYVFENYGYDKYPGNCHIIPNAAVIVLALLYGKGDFENTIKICNLCGWDTDCNVGNVGCILGVKCGVKGIRDYWREPINDVFVSSTLIGDINVTDIPLFSAYVARLGYIIAGEEVPEEINKLDAKGEIYNFKLPGSTHGFKCYEGSVKLKNIRELSFKGEGALEVEIHNEKMARVYRKSYYRVEDFDDDRYLPDFSPLVYPGYTLNAKVMTELKGVRVKIFVKEGNSKTYIYGPETLLKENEWTNLMYKIPELSGACIEEIGIVITSEEPINGRVYMDNFNYEVSPEYTLDFSKERMENWTVTHNTPAQLTYLKGIWSLEEGYLRGSGYGNCESYTGSRKWKDYELECEIKPIEGNNHNVNFRVWGAMRSYAAGLAEGKIVLYKNEEGKYKELKSSPLDWKKGDSYKIGVKAINNKITVYLEGNEVISYEDIDNPYLKGQAGFSNLNGGCTYYKYLKVKGL